MSSSGCGHGSWCLSCAAKEISSSSSSSSTVSSSLAALSRLVQKDKENETQFVVYANICPICGKDPLHIRGIGKTAADHCFCPPTKKILQTEEQRNNRATEYAKEVAKDAIQNKEIHAQRLAKWKEEVRKWKEGG